MLCSDAAIEQVKCDRFVSQILNVLTKSSVSYIEIKITVYDHNSPVSPALITQNLIILFYLFSFVLLEIRLEFCVSLFVSLLLICFLVLDRSSSVFLNFQYSVMVLFTLLIFILAVLFMCVVWDGCCFRFSEYV